jgi:hypothetical protein
MFDFLDIGISVKIIVCVNVGKWWKLIICVDVWFFEYW